MNKKIGALFLAVCLSFCSGVRTSVPVLAQDVAVTLPEAGLAECGAGYKTGDNTYEVVVRDGVQYNLFDTGKASVRGLSSKSDGVDVKVAATVTEGDRTYDVTSVAGSAFYRSKKLKSITLPSSITWIQKAAFYQCTNLKSIEMSPNITTIGQAAFYQCSSLKSIELPDGVTTIEQSAFAGSGLESITLPSALKKIDIYVFKSTNLKNVAVPSNITVIKDEAFSGCEKLESVMFPDELISVGRAAFRGCKKLKSIALPEKISVIQNGIFADCTGLTDVALPAGLSRIGYMTFFGCTALKRLTLPKSVGRIDDRAFEKCSSLESLMIPSSATAIKGKDSFKDCKKLTIYCEAGSKAEAYAKKYKIACKRLDDAPAVGCKSVSLTIGGKKADSTLKVQTGKNYTFKAEVAPYNASPNVTWSSSNEGVATVKEGKVSVKKAGTAVISVKTADGKSAKVTLKAQTGAVKVTKVSVFGVKQMRVNSKQKLVAEAAPVTAGNSKVSWKSSDKKIAVVDGNGNVTAKKSGTVTITATAKDGSGKKGKIEIIISDTAF